MTQVDDEEGGGGQPPSDSWTKFFKTEWIPDSYFEVRTAATEAVAPLPAIAVTVLIQV